MNLPRVPDGRNVAHVMATCPNCQSPLAHEGFVCSRRCGFARRTPGTTFVAVLTIIKGAFVALGGVALLLLGFAGAAIGAAAAGSGNDADGFVGAILAAGGAILGVIGAFVLAIAVVTLLAGNGLLKLRNGWRILVIVVAVVSGLGNLLAVVSGSFFSLIGLGLDVAVILILMNPTVKATFGVFAAPPPGATPTP